MPLETQQAAARKLNQAVQDSAGELRWTDDLVAITASLPDEEAFAALRSAWDDFAMRDAIVAVLARSPQPLDRGRFVESLASVQATTIELAASALERLGGPADEAELAAAFTALRQACLAAEQKGLRQVLVQLLTTWTGQTIAVDDPGKGRSRRSISPGSIGWPQHIRLPRPRSQPRQPLTWPPGKSVWSRSTRSQAMRSAESSSSSAKRASNVTQAPVL